MTNQSCRHRISHATTAPEATSNVELSEGRKVHVAMYLHEMEGGGPEPALPEDIQSWMPERQQTRHSDLLQSTCKSPDGGASNSDCKSYQILRAKV